MTTEGYIKFRAHWTPSPPFSSDVLAELNTWRQRCYEKGWIGALPDGIGFGNISQREGEAGTFFISGSATGNIPLTDAAHYALVERVHAQQNELWCRGPVIASSESMSHAAVYACRPAVQAVIHIHQRPMWAFLLAQGHATDPQAAYGSPEMALAIADLLHTWPEGAPQLFAMAGHEEGIIAFGASLEEAFLALERIAHRL